MSWSSLFDKSHILKGVPIDAGIELQCRHCKILFKTKNTYYIGYSEIFYSNSKEASRCNHDTRDLKPTNNWFPSKDIHKELKDGSWASIFDYTHIIEGAPVDADIELKCKRCNTLFYTKNAYYVGYSEVFYVNSEEQGICKHLLRDLKLTNRWFPASEGNLKRAYSLQILFVISSGII